MQEKYIIVDANKLHNRRQRQLLYDNINIYKLILIEVFKKKQIEYTHSLCFLSLY